MIVLVRLSGIQKDGLKSVCDVELSLCIRLARDVAIGGFRD